MMQYSRHSLSILALCGMALLTSCAGSKTIATSGSADDPELYGPSRMSAAALVSEMSESVVTSIRGRARVQFSAPGNSERGIADFIADRTNMLITLRNNLGIEGGIVLADQDSVLLYYSIDKTAWKLSVDDYESLPDISLRLPLNLMSVLQPVVAIDEIVLIQENDGSYMVDMVDGSILIVDKKTLLPNSIRFKSTVPDRFSEFVYESYARLNGVQLPRRIQAVTTDRKSRIRFDVLDLEVNPSNLQFTLTIPAGIPIYR